VVTKGISLPKASAGLGAIWGRARTEPRR